MSSGLNSAITMVLMNIGYQTYWCKIRRFERESEKCKTLQGALPYVGGYQVPVIYPPFLRRSYTQWPPFFHSIHTQWLLFFFFFLHTNCKFLCASHAFWEIQQFCGNFNIKFANFWMKLHFCKLNDTHFLGESTPKKAPFFLVCFCFLFCFHTEWPLYDEILHQSPLLSFSGRHLYITFIFECPLKKKKTNKQTNKTKNKKQNKTKQNKNNSLTKWKSLLKTSENSSK